MSSWAINCKFNYTMHPPLWNHLSKSCCATMTQIVKCLSVKKYSRMQVPDPVILTYSFWLCQRGCIKGIAKSWVFVKWRWMGWFGLKVIFYLGSDAMCLVMQQPLSQQHDSPGKWILIRKGWCFFSPLFFPLHSSHLLSLLLFCSF